MVNMLPTVLMPLLPVVWAFIASAYWWRQLSAPWLFAVAALLALLGIQVVVSILWDSWPFIGTNGYFFEGVSDTEMQHYLEDKNRAAMMQAVIVLGAAIPFLLWLKSGFSIAHRS
jgi:hypothetical protein